MSPEALPTHGADLSRRSFLLLAGAVPAVAKAIGGQLPPEARSSTGGDSGTPPASPDREVISQADLWYQTPVARSEEGMPVGNGRMGSLVWTSPTALKFQINRADVFGQDSNTKSFPERDTDYASGCGYVDIHVAEAGAAVFEPPAFRQYLAVYDGLMTAQGEGVQARLFAWHRRDVMAIEVADVRPQPDPLSVDLRMLRYGVQFHMGQNHALAQAHAVLIRTRSHTAASRLEIRQGRIILVQEFREEAFYCASAVAIGVSGRPAKARYLNESTLRLSAPASHDPMVILIASAASFDPRQDVAALALGELDAAAPEGFAALWADNQRWWQAFWTKSVVRLRSADGAAEWVARHYHYYLYLMASSSRGLYPPRFGGMLWLTNGDMRMWGSQHWLFNLATNYEALPATNHWELLEPVFNMYSAMLAAAARAARQQWGSQGIYIPEVSWFNGLEELPEDIAAEMRELYLLRKPWAERSARFRAYAELKQPYSSRWNFKDRGEWLEGRFVYPERPVPPFGPINHLFSSQAKLAWWYWLRYEYTQDQTWLRDRAYPMLKGVAEFYRNYPKVVKGADGKYHIHDVNNHEPIQGAQDTMEEIASMRGIFHLVLRAAEILDVDAALRPGWRELVEHLADYPSTADANALADAGAGDRIRWANGRAPAHFTANLKTSDHTMIPVVYYDLCTLETSNPELWARANATFEAMFPGGINDQTVVGSLTRAAAIAAHLGRPDDLRTIMLSQLRRMRPDLDTCDWEGTGQAGNFPNRLALREGPGSIDCERLGRASEGLLAGLLQSVAAGPGQDSVIRVFPAWPRQWNAEFTLLARGGFLVSAAMRDGAIEFVEINSQIGGTCRLRNPWGAESVSLQSRGEAERSLAGSLLIFATAKGQLVRLRRCETPA